MLVSCERAGSTPHANLLTGGRVGQWLSTHLNYFFDPRLSTVFVGFKRATFFSVDLLFLKNCGILYQ